MGQKVNPRGLRTGIIFNWTSRWFFSNKKSYRDALISDIRIRETLMDRFNFANITQVDIERAINKITTIIYSVKPGMIIGRGGKGLEDVKKLVLSGLRLGNKSKEVKIDLKIEPVKKPYQNAYYIAQSIADRLVKGFPHRSVVHNMISRAKEAGVKGIKIQLGGRIAGAEISRREKYFEGSVPTSTIREDVDFARFAALTKSGYIGIKVWLCK